MTQKMLKLASDMEQYAAAREREEVAEKLRGAG
jgi:hypothetical protein